MAAKLRRILVVWVAGLLYYSGLLRAWRLFRRLILRKREVCVLAMHRVLSGEEEPRGHSLQGMMLREETFARMLGFLQREFQVLSLAEFLQDGGAAPGDSRPRCLLTFDDGWRDNYSTAFPWLKKFGMPATIFLTTGMVGTSKVFWVEQIVWAWKDPARRQEIQSGFRERKKDAGETPGLEEVVEFCKHMPAEAREQFLCSLGVPRNLQSPQCTADQMLTWDQVKEMGPAGVDFGSHTVTHPLLTFENDKSVNEELTISKRTIEEVLGKEVQAFAYPNGDWNDNVRRAVKDAGYWVAFTTRRGWHIVGQDPCIIPRIMLHEGNITGLNGRFSRAVLSLRLSGLY